MKQIVITLTLLFCATLSFAQELKVKSFTHDQMSLEARVGGGRKDLNGKQCALIKVQVRDDIVDCTGGNVGEIISKGIVKKIFVSPDTRFLKFEFKYNYPLKVTFADYGIKSLAEGATYTITLVDANVITQQQLQQYIQQMPQQHPIEVIDSVSEEIDSVYIDVVDSVVVDSAYVDDEATVVIDSVYVSTETSNHLLPITVNGVTFNMIKVDGGTFTMGATSELGDPFDWEKPTHQVTLSSYYIGETEVTQALWKAVMGKNPSRFKGGNKPVEMVSWEDCQTFIGKLNGLTGKRFRLPTEAEWEYAARGGKRSNHTQYSGGSMIDDVAWYDGNSGSKTHSVKTKKPNELGLYDMSGNVWEWCQDWYGSYSSNAQTNPTGPDSGSRRVHRGGSWNDYERYCRSSFRFSDSPGLRYGNLGFRLALSE